MSRNAKRHLSNKRQGYLRKIGSDLFEILHWLDKWQAQAPRWIRRKLAKKARRFTRRFGGRASTPQHFADLGIRERVCAGCGASYDRDVNAARNILAAHGR